jgi:antitoxin (DNA-binding transcriptional repressor) of toxin-antitoxin stability system
MELFPSLVFSLACVHFVRCGVSGSGGQYGAATKVVQRQLVLQMLYHLCMKTTTMAYAKAHLPELIERVARGERIIIMRYKKPVAELGPSLAAEKPQRKFGTGKGKAFLIDPRALKPLTDAEADAFIEGRY